MAQDTQFILHPVDWSHAVFFTAIPEASFVLGDDTAATTTFLVGAGQGELTGVVLGNCFFSVPAQPCSQNTNPSIDPPPPYVASSTTSPYGRDYLNLNLRMIRRDDFTFSVAVTLNGAPLDITGATLRFTAKWSVKDSDANAVFQLSTSTTGITITDASNGKATVTVASGLTAALPAHRTDLVYDMQLFTATGTTATVLYGTLTIMPDVTVTAP